MARPSLTVLLACASLLCLPAVLLTGCGGTQTVATPSTHPENATIVALFAGDTLTVSEFERLYARTVGSIDEARDDSLEAYQDYLERYVDFRLKVLEAEEAGYRDDAGIQQEIQNYRGSFARPYLLDREVMNPIVLDVYEKSRQIVDASHILIRVDANAPPADTLAAYNRIAALRDSVEQGADFGLLALRHSEDPSASTDPNRPGYKGRLGFFSAGGMVQEFEDAAYATPVGSVSPIIRTQFGYHVLYVHDKQPTPDAVRVSHIMLRPAQPTAEDSAATMQQALDLKQRIEQGEDFAALAREFSIEKQSGQRGGELGVLSYASPQTLQIPSAFREAAFALGENEVSDVVVTPFGYHLILVSERIEPKSFEEQYESLKQSVSRLPRTQAAEKALAADLRTQYNARIDSTALLNTFDGIAPDSLQKIVATDGLPAAASATVFAHLGDSTYTLDQLLEHARTARLPRATSTSGQVLLFADDFLSAAAIDYEAAALEERDVEFRQVMQEFRDGLILFKLMEDSVWTAAMQDSVALQAYYDAHRDDFRFDERVRVVALRSPSDSLLLGLSSRLDAGQNLAAVVEAAGQADDIEADTVVVGEQTGSVYDYALSLQPGEHTMVLRDQMMNGYVVLVHEGTEPARPKTFEEARAEVANAYQSQLEDRLLRRLRAKYNARTFPERLTQAFGDMEQTSSTSPSAE